MNEIVHEILFWVGWTCTVGFVIFEVVTRCINRPRVKMNVISNIERTPDVKNQHVTVVLKNKGRKATNLVKTRLVLDNGVINDRSGPGWLIKPSPIMVTIEAEELRFLMKAANAQGLNKILFYEESGKTHEIEMPSYINERLRNP